MVHASTLTTAGSRTLDTITAIAHLLDRVMIVCTGIRKHKREEERIMLRACERRSDEARQGRILRSAANYDRYAQCTPAR